MSIFAHIRAIGLVVAAMTAPCAVSAKDLTVFAAASLRGALDEIASLSADNITLSYAGSGLIARQVSQGAPADIVVLAHPIWMDWLTEKDLLIAGTRTDVAANTLAVIAPAPSPDQDLHQILKTNRIAMGQRDAVPAGIYAKQWLETTGLWADIEANVIETDNVRLALALVARGDVPVGITYRSDALSDPRVRIMHDIDPTTHSPIRYPAAAITNEGRAFMMVLTSPHAQDIFRSHGFAPLVQD